MDHIAGDVDLRTTRGRRGVQGRGGKGDEKQLTEALEHMCETLQLHCRAWTYAKARRGARMGRFGD